MYQSRCAFVVCLGLALLAGLTYSGPAQVTNTALQLRLNPNSNRVDLLLEGEGSPGALFIYQSSDPRRLAPCPPVLVQTNTALTNELRFSLPLSTRRFFRAAHWPGRPVQDFANQSMAYVPGGSFAMGDGLVEGPAEERPARSVQVGGFWMDKYEVSLALWEEVRGWALQNGYSFETGAQGKSADHPVHSVSWYDAVKWCNARSEKEGRVPAYYTDALLGTASIYRSGQLNVQNKWVNWENGYRLPTEAEWEKAARGGASGLRFPCLDTLSHADANYFSTAAYQYDLGPTRNHHPIHAVEPRPFTSPVGWFQPSGFGLYDLDGNVREWCWDLHDPDYYTRSLSTDPKGPDTGVARVVRGGSWSDPATQSRVASRAFGMPGMATNSVGFRTVLPATSYLASPVIVSHPQGSTNLAGGLATATVSVSGTPPIALQWRREGGAVAGETNRTLRLTNFGVAVAGSYDVVATNLYGIVTSSVALLQVVTMPPTLLTQPQSRSNQVGTVASFSVAASGAGPLNYQWRARGVNLLDGDRVQGAMTAQLDVTVSFEDGGAYDVVVSSPYGSVTSSVAQLTILLPPRLVTQPMNRTNEVGTTVALGVAAIGTEPLHYQWRKAAGVVAGATNSNLLVTNAQLTDDGSYDVVITNAYGSVTSAVAVVTVTPFQVPDLLSMALVDGGSFTMGDSVDGVSSALPVHTVQVNAFYMDRYEVTKALWDEVYGWALTNGYSFEAGADSRAPNHPVFGVTWYDAVKWCNARSEKEGRVPCYYSNGMMTTVYRSGQIAIQNDWVRWEGGYRLPTEAEWEKAARGRLTAQRFPWGATISHDQANYISDAGYPYDVSLTRGWHPAYSQGEFRYTSPVGSFPANVYGLHDMAGNVREWCWDIYSNLYYAASHASNPKGPTAGTYRICRGGGWDSMADNCQVSRRFAQLPGGIALSLGFRSVLSPRLLTPQIHLQPAASNTRDVGGQVALEVLVVGAEPLRYQWRRETLPLFDQTNATCLLTNLQPGQQGFYDVVITNAYGSATSRVSLLNLVSNMPGMRYIPSGSFLMGDSTGERSDCFPTSTVFVSAFYIDVHEVTLGLWTEVYSWATNNGYVFNEERSKFFQGKANNHPVLGPNWIDSVVWCNARSEREGRVPSYYTDALQSNVLRDVNQAFIPNSAVRWDGHGYRLPTEAEWEKAARGGFVGRRFSWGNTITHSNANYSSSEGLAYDVSPTRGYHPAYAFGALPYTSPVGAFQPNDYGVYDMVGNATEWCWDRAEPWILCLTNTTSSFKLNPRGPETGYVFVFRGGGWAEGSLMQLFGRGGLKVATDAGAARDAWGFRTVVGIDAP